MTATEREEGVSLLELLRNSYKTDDSVTFLREEDPLPGVKLPDGYVRLSPVQPYQEGPNYRRKRIRTAVILVLIAAALVVAAVILCLHVVNGRRWLKAVILAVMAAALIVTGIIFWILFLRK